ncbi:uncharacterized protein [Chironomus tepperi]|uniref:uncharacterized protein n=1 Tax=Chironomus tepperi TaxID=113505 RepID=UPI00391FAB86
MTVPRASQFCCIPLAFLNLLWAFAVLTVTVFAFLATISFGIVKVIDIEYDEYENSRNQLLALVERMTGHEVNAQNWTAVILILVILIIICNYYINGIKKKIPQNLLPFTFINAFAGMSLIVSNISDINTYFCIGAILCFTSICSYSLYDNMLAEIMENLKLELQEANQSTKNTNKVPMYPRVPPPYSINNIV